MTPEGYVKKAVEDLLRAERIPCFRMNSGNAVIPGRGRIRLNDKGTADLLAAPIVKRWNGEFLVGEFLCSIFLWIECKAPKAKPTKEQLEFSDFVRNRGHYYLLVDDVKILQEWLKENRAR